ncbi:hypothetical protein J6590_052390 [Homalodisca vitripennis]|nr:hypothetical protein J6590_052390 [Homalodisca vitripennis]
MVLVSWKNTYNHRPSLQLLRTYCDPVQAQTQMKLYLCESSETKLWIPQSNLLITRSEHIIHCFTVLDDFAVTCCN